MQVQESAEIPLQSQKNLEVIKGLEFHGKPYFTCTWIRSQQTVACGPNPAAVGSRWFGIFKWLNQKKDNIS